MSHAYSKHAHALETGAVATGIPTRVPQHAVHQAALNLRQLLDDGISPEDPRCCALLQLINAARLIILPASNNGAKIANDIGSRAAHIDVSTATMAAIMGLKNVSSLTGAATQEVAVARANDTALEQNQHPPKKMTLNLLPKPARKATEALINLIKNDDELGLRARNEVLTKTHSMAIKMNKLRAGQRHASVRKRRLMAEQVPEYSPSHNEHPASQPDPPVLSMPAPSPFAHASSSAPPPPYSFAPPPVTNPASAFAPMPVAVPAPAPVPMPASVMAATSSSALPSTAFKKYALPRRNMAYSTPVQLPIEYIPPTPPPKANLTPDGVSAAPTYTEAPPPLTPQTPQSQPQSQPAVFSRYRARQNVPAREFRPSPAVLSAQEMAGVNESISTPDEMMDAFMHPLNKNYQLPHESPDNPTRIRLVLAERERILSRLLRRRQSELAAIPLGMTEQTRRKAIIEAKQLSVLDLQRAVRYRVCAEMKKMSSLAVQEDGVVPSDHLSRLFRRRDPPIYSYTDGYPRITPFDGIPEMQPRPASVVAQDSMRMAQFDMSRMHGQKMQRKRDFNAKLIAHYENFQNTADYARNCRARISKGFERYFLEKKRMEEKKRKMERIERLRLLRSNDEQAYFNLLKDTKNERLLQLVRQTDNYLMRIGAQVEKSRENLNGPEAGPAHNAFTEELGEHDQVPIEAMRRRRDLYYTVTHSVQEEVRQPSIMVHGTLKPYQIEGLKWMVSLYNNNLNGILADEMGLGKTIQTISLITYLVETKKNPGPFLIIVPLSTMGNWVRELELWAPSLVKVCYRGDKYTRRAIQQREMGRGEFNILLTTYEFTVKDQNVLSRTRWQYIIIDEGHRMKNANCKLAMTLGVKYKSRNRLLLTGTPLQNNLTELWALLNFLLPTIFSSADNFETWFKQPFESTTLGDTAELEEEETLLVINRLHQVLRPFLLRRLKTDVESQLPDKVEHVLRCDMSAWQRVLYRQVQNRIGLATGVHNGSVKSYNNLLMQCKKICNHPYLFYDAEAILDLPHDYLIRASGKFFLLQHMLPKLRKFGHRTLIFSQMTAALDYLEDFLAAIGIQYMRLDGNTRADDRQELLNLFNAKDSPFFCFLLSTRAGGLGLNLQTADTVIIFDSDWNPMMDLQAQDRAHRIGQTKEVRVYRLICSGTVEVKILEKANQKLQVDAQVIQAGQFNNKSTETDRNQMLKNLLRQRNEEGDELGAVPDMEELNRLFARTEDEIEYFSKYDEESKANKTFHPLFETDAELPAWVLQPDVEARTAEEKEKEILQSHGRGRRRRKPNQEVNYTDHEWMKIMEGEMTGDEVLERRKQRALRLSARNEANGQVTTTESESRSAKHEESSERGMAVDSSIPHGAEKSGSDETRGSTPSQHGQEKANAVDNDHVARALPFSQEDMEDVEESDGASADNDLAKNSRPQDEFGKDDEIKQSSEDEVSKIANQRLRERKTMLESQTIGSEHKSKGNNPPVFLKLRIHRPNSSPKGMESKTRNRTKLSAPNGAMEMKQISEVEPHEEVSSERQKQQFDKFQGGGSKGTLKKRKISEVDKKLTPKKRKQQLAQSPSDEIVMREETIQENPVPRKRKRAPSSSRPREDPLANGSVRKSGRKKLRTGAGKRLNGVVKSIDEVSNEEESDVSPVEAEDANNLDLDESELDEDEHKVPRQSILLKLRIRKEGSRRRRSTYRG